MLLIITHNCIYGFKILFAALCLQHSLSAVGPDAFSTLFDARAVFTVVLSLMLHQQRHQHQLLQQLVLMLKMLRLLLLLMLLKQLLLLLLQARVEHRTTAGQQDLTWKCNVRTR